MASAAPMKRRRRTLPGMPAGAAAENGSAERPLAAAPTSEPEAEPEAADGAGSRPVGEGKGELGDPEPVLATAQQKRTARPRGRQQAPATAKAPEAEVNPYTGEGTSSLTVRILVSVHARYRKLVRDLEAEGYKASATELFQALLHFGPTDTAEARELLRRWRALLDADPSPR